MEKTNTPVAVQFDDTKIAFAGKSDRELQRANLLFSLMNIPWLVAGGGRLAQWAFRMGLPIEWLVKPTIYRHFCGGETLEEVHRVIDRLGEHGIKTILDYGVEAKETEADWDQTAQFLTRNLELAKADEDIHIISSKLTGLFRDALLEKVSRGEALPAREEAEYERGLARVDMICRAAYDGNIGIHIDAEESWKQGAIDQIAWEMSRRYNTNRPTVINAVQLYRKDRLQFLQDSLDHARAHGYLCAVKLVRGAYMEKERARAAEENYPSPIHDTLADTHRAYNQGLKFCIDHLGDMYVCNATHNEASCRYQLELMAAKGIANDHPLTATAQLYGMGDHLSYNMARAGYNVEKYLPYGPVREVIPYLLRRTQENTSVGGQMSRELSLIRKEIQRRAKES